MPIFETRSFPPPSLVGVPIEYIIDQLHKLAPGYWDHPETADCTIIVPVPHYKPRLHHHEPEPLASPVPTYDATGRRATEPCINIMPRLTMNLHTDYLLAHSTFLRTILSDASPIDLINPSPSLTSASLRTPSGNYTIPPDRLPRLMPSSTARHPVLYVPVPDPSSVHLLIHWMYFGDTTLIRDALRRRVIHWEGIARNVEYLGLPSDIKVFLGSGMGFRRAIGLTLRTRAPVIPTPTLSVVAMTIAK
ncbi:hypothetical protein BDZ89DRAFT_1135583 [Hymenopellis radicata]|nr:hypothetical protein BDZ89DRAFT_1135583 [Hymenopellis radicata]